ncbi:MAG: MBL fold metallo-hydrolase [Candidatus Omnitrophica bacterium]|nr:MBL fold metallo-hydrolase [Candidatus Omnitrophota bacterium]
MPKIFEYKKCLSKALRCFLTAVFFLPLYVFPALASDGLMKMHFIDVGYGDAILIEFPDGEAALIDAGQSEHAGCLMKYLADRNIENLKTAILTHPQEDHFGGFFFLIKKKPIGELYINGDTQRAEEAYDDLIKIIEGNQIPITILKEGDELLLGGGEVRFSVLHPLELEGSVNDNVLVFWIVYKETSFLLTSDMQELDQDELLARYPQVKSANIVQVPHHGGKMTERFTGFFRDDVIFIVSTGTNEYGKPLVEELDKLKGKVYRTDLHGSIELRSDGHQVKVMNE